MNCKDIVIKYLKSLELNFITEPTEIGCHVITPFMGFNGEPIHFYVEEYSGFLRLTDAGNSLLDLKTLDIDVSNGKEKEIQSKREKIKRRTMALRREQNLMAASV